jgi:putative Holliday junction resolvase
MNWTDYPVYDRSAEFRDFWLQSKIQEYSLNLSEISDSNTFKFEVIQKIIEEWQPISIVVGVPFNVDGSEHKVTNLSRKFAKQLEQKYSLPTHLIDERYTSIEANHEIKDKKIDLKKKKLLIDQIAAKIILQSYLDQI